MLVRPPTQRVADLRDALLLSSHTSDLLSNARWSSSVQRPGRLTSFVVLRIDFIPRVGLASVAQRLHALLSLKYGWSSRTGCGRTSILVLMSACHDLDRPPQVYSPRVEKEKRKEGVALAANADHDAANVICHSTVQNHVLYNIMPYIYISRTYETLKTIQRVSFDTSTPLDKPPRHTWQDHACVLFLRRL